MYILLTSKFVFNAKDYNEILRRNKQCHVYFPKKTWENLSPESQELCSMMLQKHPNNRISAEQALNHKWFKMHQEDPKMSISRNMSEEHKNIFNQQQDKEDFN